MRRLSNVGGRNGFTAAMSAVIDPSDTADNVMDTQKSPSKPMPVVPVQSSRDFRCHRKPVIRCDDDCASQLWYRALKLSRPAE